LNTYRFYERLSAVFSPEGAKALMETLTEYFGELENTVTKTELHELQDVVQRLAEAQERTERRVEQLAAALERNEERLAKLEAAVERLVAAQERNEERLAKLEAAVERLVAAQERNEERLAKLEAAVERLVAAQERNEERLAKLEAAVERLIVAQERNEERCVRLEAAVAALAEAQKRTELRVEELAEAQKRTEQRLEELAAAQKRTEATVERLVIGLAETRQMVGGLSDAVGYGLEDRAIKELPRLLAEEYGVQVKGRLVRRFVRYVDGKKDELNIFGEGVRDGEPVTVCGEAKARLARKHVDALCRLGERLVRSGEAKHPLFLLAVTYSVEPEVEAYAASRQVAVIPSYLV